MILFISPISFLQAILSKFCKPHQRVFKEDLSLCLRMGRECLPVFMASVIQPEVLEQADGAAVLPLLGTSIVRAATVTCFPPQPLAAFLLLLL